AIESTRQSPCFRQPHSWPSIQCHIFTLPSSLAEATVSPSGAKATARTALMCPSRMRLTFPEEVSQIVTLPRALPVAKDLESGANATANTGALSRRMRSGMNIQNSSSLFKEGLPNDLANGVPLHLFGDVHHGGTRFVFSQE